MKKIVLHFLLITFLSGFAVLVDSCKKEEVNELEIPPDTIEYETITDARDGQVYKIVKIGEQTWFAENLRFKLPTKNRSNCYDKNENHCKTYGRLYESWEWIMNGELCSDSVPSGVKGICPDGWHMPSDGEWKVLEMQLGMSKQQADTTGFRGTNEGEIMKSNGGWLSGGNGTDKFGFKALPSGWGGWYPYVEDWDNWSFFSIGVMTGFYSCSEGTDYFPSNWVRCLYVDNTKVLRRSIQNTYYGYSVRCVKD